MAEEKSYADLFGAAGEPVPAGTLETINAILGRIERMLSLGLQLAMQFDKIRNNPALQKLISSRMQKLGVQPASMGPTESKKQGGGNVANVANVASGDADQQIDQAVKLLEMCKLWAGDITISKLIEHINANREFLKAQISGAADAGTQG